MQDQDLPHAQAVNAFYCLRCGKLLNGVVDVAGTPTPPSAGDFSMCAGCQNIAVFDLGPFGYTLRAMTADDWADFEELRAELLSSDDEPNS